MTNLMDNIATEDGESAVRRTLWGQRVERRWTRQELARRVKTSNGTVQTFEYGTRGLKNHQVIQFVKALGAAAYVRDWIAAALLPGVAGLNSGCWPPRMPDEVRDHVMGIKGPAAVLRVPEQDLLLTNAEWDRLMPWAKAAPPTAEKPVNFVVASLKSPEAKIGWLNWRDYVHRQVYVFLFHSRVIADKKRVREIISECEDHPDWREMTTPITEKQVYDNLSLIRDPDTGVVRRFRTIALKNLYPDQNAGQIVVLQEVDRPALAE